MYSIDFHGKPSEIVSKFISPHRLTTMPPFLESVESCFATRDLYEALGVEKTAKESELRRAYHRLSLKVHPDRVPPDQVQDATQKFQVSSMLFT